MDFAFACGVDWEKAGKLVTDSVVAAAAVATALAAWCALSTWRKELFGKTEFDVASRLLLAAFQVRDAMVVARASPLFGRAYLDVLEPHEAEQVVAQRWAPVYACIARMQVVALEAEVALSSEVLDKVKAVTAAAERARRDMSRYSVRKVTELQPPADQVATEEPFGSLDDEVPDKRREEMKTAIRALENALKVYLPNARSERKRKWLGLWR